ncbi:MAG: hypothetical protein OEW35_08560 [Gammaproteobacteria bacterium]|nr:hypothetical protein [Gammaproteobacteria bacterium]MDH4255796.1 hypothetical protein [Gammaproteobacteria bacterium]MDH5309239.1 hypothetical protein [Gammaproteobacteria bacterium]
MTKTVMISGESDRSILFVHGRSFKPSAGPYLEILAGAVAAGVEGDYPESLSALASVSKALAYYGDLTNEFLAAQGQAYDEQLDVSDMRNVLHELRALDRKKGFSVARYDKLPGKSAVSEFAASVLAPVLSAVGLEKPLVSTATKDLGEYWKRDSDLGIGMLRRVRDCICAALDADQRLLLVSHGTGSILTWDALWDLSHDPDYAPKYADAKIDVWVTLGSPLGDSMVRKQLRGADRKGRERYPTNVLAWHNVSAEDDYMSHDSTLSDDYKPMLKQRQISSIRDYRIYNMAVRYGRSNPHNVLGYLVHPRVAKIVNDWLTQSFGQPAHRSLL